MEIEIELKYLVDGENVEVLINEILEQNNAKFHQSSVLLGNSYFDTQELALRQLDMGLRVRTSQDFCEQTIKTAGRVVGGLHQRPEYNIPINTPQPDLLLFPRDIWPSNTEIDVLNQSIVSLFTTDFQRKTWFIEHELGCVELVFDQGTITSGTYASDIKELELELSSGDISALFEVAKWLFSQIQMRSGLKSKAARGYQLWHQQNQKNANAHNNNVNKDNVTGVLADDTRDLLITLTSSQTVSGALYLGIEYCLTTMQKLIADYIESPSMSFLFSIRDCLSTIKYGVILIDDVMSAKLSLDVHQQLDALIHELTWLDKAQHVSELTTKSGSYRKKVENSQKLIELLKLKRDNFPRQQSINALLQSEAFNQLQLDILALMLKPSQSSIELKLTTFAEQALDKGLANLVNRMSKEGGMSPSEYIELKPQLTQSLLAGTWFGSLYSQEQRNEYRSPWLDILSGIDELEIYALLQRQLQQLDEQPEKIIRWLDTKVENLVDALEYSRKMAISVTPYWHQY